jgi:C-terminal processing protease CtpA/Prc
LEVDGGATTVWQVTPNTCVEGYDDFALDISGSTAVANGYVVTHAAVATEYQLDPVELPAGCGAAATDSGTSLTVLDETFTMYYPFLADRGFDWDGALAALRATVGSSEDTALFENALTDLTAHLGDGHTFVDDESSNSARSNAFLGTIADDIEEAEAALEEEIGLTREDLLPGTMGSGADGHVVWGELTPDVGYLAIDSFEEIGGRPDDVAGDLASLAEALDAAFSDVGDLPDLVVDLRFNEGGLEVAALLAAGYFVDSLTPAFDKYAHAAPERTHQTVEIAPSSTASYGGDVTLLTSPMTASAGEVFLLAVLGSIDAMVVGEPSAGEFGESIDRVLPNGVELAMSMEIYTTLDGTGYEARGVPVDVSAHYDEAVDIALDAIEL